MGQVVQFRKTSRTALRNNINTRAHALQLISHASEILAGLCEKDQKIGWILDDCLDMLSSGDRDFAEPLAPIIFGGKA